MTALVVLVASLVAWTIGEVTATPRDRPEARTLALPTGPAAHTIDLDG